MTTPRQGPGRFQWNSLAWLGVLFSASLWLLILAGIHCFKDGRVAVIVLACWLVAMAIGLGLWLRRDRVPPYQAIMVLIATLGIATAVAFVTLDWFGHLNDFGQRRSYWLLILFPGLMLRFYLLERHARQTEDLT